MHSPISKQKLIMLLVFLSLVILFYYIKASDNSPKNSTSQENDTKITIVAHRQNEFGDMWVFDIDQFRCLSSEPPTLKVSNQSCMIKERPSELVFDYTKMQVSAIFLHPYPQKILILGLGGASMPKAISKALPNADLDIVEINQNVVDLSQEFFAFTPTSKMHIHVADGVDFIKKAHDNTYDLIIMDAFNQSDIPAHMLQEEFVAGIYRALGHEGKAIINTLLKSKTHDRETELFTKIFGKILSSKVGGNRIIMVQKDSVLNLDEISANYVTERSKMNMLGIYYRKMIDFLNDPS